jgi:hypothetical protein
VAVGSSSALLFFGNGTPVMSIEIPKFAKELPIPSRALDVWSRTCAFRSAFKLLHPFRYAVHCS